MKYERRTSIGYGFSGIYYIYGECFGGIKSECRRCRKWSEARPERQAVVTKS